MRILLLYHNFIRDFRGFLLLARLLESQGHSVWILAHWNKAIYFTKVMNIDVIVTGQIAESSTYKIAEFAKDNKIRLVINSTENVTLPENFEAFLSYNNTQINDEYIDLQTIASHDIYEFVQNNTKIKNKWKYKLLGFPRLDLASNEGLRQIEDKYFRKKYKLNKFKKVYLFISSFLLEGAFEGLTEEDKQKYKLIEFQKRTELQLNEIKYILKSLIDNEIGKENVLLIKKHPWDCSSYFKDTFESPNCLILDSTEYIIPCINCADFILHTYSTSAIEAWIMKKKTISILPLNEQFPMVLNHMKYEIVVSNYKELSYTIKNYPATPPYEHSLELFEPYLDGKATLRLANEINALKPHPNKTLFKASVKAKFRLITKYVLHDWSIVKYRINKTARVNTKIYDLLTWENERYRVKGRYRNGIKKYVNSIIEQI